MEAKAIKDGYMETGRMFCRKGEIYEYSIKKNSNEKDAPIIIKTLDSSRHHMSYRFFNEHFIDMEEDIILFLDEKDFEL